MKTYKDLQGWYDWHNLIKKLIPVHLPVHGVYVEVGVWKGKSLVALAQELQTFGRQWELIGVDLFGGHQDDENMVKMVAESGGDFYMETRQNLIDCGVDAQLIRADSARAANRFEDGSIDLILIDALHTYDAVKRDTLAWMPKLRKGGIMMWHDCDRDVVRRAVNDSWGRNWEMSRPRTGWAIKK